MLAPPPKHSLEVFGHAYVCLSAWQCCPVQSAFLGLQGGEAAEPLKICRALCVWICLVCARFEPSSCLSTPHPLAHLSGGFKSKPQDLACFSHGAAENKLVRSPPSHFPRESTLRIDWSCSPPPRPAPPLTKGPGNRWSFQFESQNLAMRGLSTTAGVCMAWVAVTGALRLASSFPAAPPVFYLPSG